MDADGRRLPGSLGQRLLWMMERYRGGSGTLNSPVLFRLRGTLDASALSAALAELTRRHEALRTTMTGGGHRLTQVIHEPRVVPIESVDLRRARDPQAESRRILVTELNSGIDVESWPVRATLWRVASDDHLLCINMHHFVTDGWSNAVIARELGGLYNRFTGLAADLPTVGWQYAQFAEWQAERTGSDAWLEHQKFWRRQLTDIRLPALPAPLERQIPAERRTGVESFGIAAEVVSRMEQLARAERTTLFTAMLGMFFALLNRQTGQEDLAVASLFANRGRPEVSNTVGFLANMLILRMEIPKDPTLRNFVRTARRTVLLALMHQEVPYQLVPIDWSARGAARPEDVTFQMLPAPFKRSSLSGIEATQIHRPDGLAARFDLEFMLVPTEHGLDGLVFFAKDRFDRTWVRRCVTEFKALVAATVHTPDEQVERAISAHMPEAL